MAKLAGTTYQELDHILVKDRTKTIGNNTTAHRGDDGVIYVYLHGHNIVDLHRDGSVCARDCGYQTVTTKERLNQFLPMPYRVSQQNYEWFIFDVEMMEKMEWVTGRGVMILPDGVLVYAAARRVRVGRRGSTHPSRDASRVVEEEAVEEPGRTPRCR